MQPGNQPVRVFYNLHIGTFNDIKNKLSAAYPAINLNSVKFCFYVDDIRARSPSTSENRIIIHDTFLSFLWSFSYGLLIKAPMSGKEITVEERENATKLLRFAKELLKTYQVWDINNLPNPGLDFKDEKDYIAKVNSVYHYAFTYIIFHEFAHIILGHLNELGQASKSSNVVSSGRRQEMETEADLFALNRMMDEVKDTEYEFNVIFGIITALSSITLTSKVASGGKFHPDPDARIRETLKELDLPEDEYIWGFSTWAFIEWSLLFK